MSGKRRRQEQRLAARKRSLLLVIAGAVAVSLVGVAALFGGPRGGATVEGTATLGEPAPEVRLTDFEGRTSLSKTLRAAR